VGGNPRGDVEPLTEALEGDGAPGAIHEKLLAEILITAAPTWLAHPSSVAQRMLERPDRLLSEQHEGGRPLAYNHVAGGVVTVAVARALAEKPVPAPS
jgi:hypothetical protein